MEKNPLNDIEQYQKRLAFYLKMKEKIGGDRSSIAEKWIDIYQKRIKLLENPLAPKITDLSNSGLKTELSGTSKTRHVQSLSR